MIFAEVNRVPCLSMNAIPVIKRLGCEHYETVWQAMRQFTDQRLAETNDEIWLLEHPPVYHSVKAAKKNTSCALTVFPLSVATGADK